MKQFMIFFLLLLLAGGCTSIVKYKPAKKKAETLKTSAQFIILYEDFIFADNDNQKLKKQVIAQIRQKMAHHPKFRLVHIPAGKSLPKNTAPGKNIMIVGNVWSRTGKTQGKEVAKVRRSKRSLTSTRSWDELENRNWEQNVLQTSVSLYFIEISTENKLLRSTLTVSNDRHLDRKVKGKININLNSRKNEFFSDKEITPGHVVLSSKAFPSDVGKAINDLASQAVNQHFRDL